MLLSGVLLLLKKDIAWIQPPSQRGVAEGMPLDIEAVLAIASAHKPLEVQTWDDVNRLDIRPGRGLVKLRANNGWELQIDWATGEPLLLAYRRSDIIEALHDGSFFHEWMKYGVFLPASLVLLLLWVSGVYLWLGVNRARRAKTRRQRLNCPAAIANPQ